MYNTRTSECYIYIYRVIYIREDLHIIYIREGTYEIDEGRGDCVWLEEGKGMCGCREAVEPPSICRRPKILAKRPPSFVPCAAKHQGIYSQRLVEHL